VENSGYSLEVAGLLCRLEGALDAADRYYAMAGHRHGCIDVNTTRLRHRIMKATPATYSDIDRTAKELISLYESIDYPRGALFVLHTILAWKHSGGLPSEPEHVEKLLYLVDVTGEVLPDFLQHPQSEVCPSSPPPLTTAHDCQQSMQHPVTLEEETATSLASWIAGPSRSLLGKLGSSLSSITNTLRGRLSDERLNDDREFSTLETLALISRIERHILRNARHPDTSVLNYLRIVKVKMPAYMRQSPELMQMIDAKLEYYELNETRRLGSPDEFLEQAESRIRAFSASETSIVEWIQYLGVQQMILSYCNRTRNFEKAAETMSSLATMKEHAPNSRRLDILFLGLQVFGKLIEATQNLHADFERAMKEPLRFGNEAENADLGIKEFAHPEVVVSSCISLTLINNKRQYTPTMTSATSLSHDGRSSSDASVHDSSDIAGIDKSVNPEVVKEMTELFQLHKERRTINGPVDPGNPESMMKDLFEVEQLFRAVQTIDGDEETIPPEVISDMLNPLQSINNSLEFLNAPLNAMDPHVNLSLPKWVNTLFAVVDMIRIPKFIQPMIASVCGVEVGLVLDYARAMYATSTSFSVSEEQIEQLRDCARRYEMIRQTDPKKAAQYTDLALLGYQMLGQCTFTLRTTKVRDLGNEPVETLRRARSYFQEAIGVIEWGFAEGVNASALWHGLQHATLTWQVGDTLKREGLQTYDHETLQLGVHYFEEGAQIARDIRGQQEPIASDIYRILEAKQQFSGEEYVRKIYKDGFVCSVLAGKYSNDETLEAQCRAIAWKWIQRSKAVSLADLLALSRTVSAADWKLLEKHPEQKALLRQEVELLGKLNSQAPIGSTTGIRKQLNDIRKRMGNKEPLQEILRDRDCDGMTPEDLTPLTLRMGLMVSCGNVTFVDWVFDTASGRMKVFSATCIMGHYNLQIEDVHDFTMPKAVAWVQANLNHRVLSNADLADHKLKELAPLVAPLRKITKPGSVLVLCPTFELHKIPLHALPIDDDQILLERNPVVYIPSLTMLHHLARLNQHGSVPMPATRPSNSPRPPPTAAVLSVYDPANASNTSQLHEADAVKSSLTTIATTLHTTLQAGQHVNVPFWSTHTRDAALIHFHGHAVSAPNGAHQALVLQPTDTTSDIGTDTPAHHLTARKILTMNFTCSPIVVNIACASGSAELKAGDELFGLTPAFLLAGAQSVVGTMWPIRSADGRAFTEAFYDELRSAGGGEGQGAVVDLARALQNAVLMIRDNEETDAPYHWASFTVCGLWKVPFGLSGSVEPVKGEDEGRNDKRNNLDENQNRDEAGDEEDREDDNENEEEINKTEPLE